ncbi:unnamed protein product [Psylliodes chrysocephalus]|uniref:Uncharacterized protein n=1 Tax=Psylliodes chrysocephalus TaxID=3402493 RepID=A0A9P0GET5_9CUCU|nr:unnamed protein product [Psylliodes chrysocephala]
MEKLMQCLGTQIKNKLFLNEQSQQICLNVYKNLLKRGYIENTSTVQEAAFLTGISVYKMNQIIKNGISSRKVREDKGVQKKLDPSMAKSIVNTVYELYKQNTIPTLDIIHRRLSETYFDTNIKKSTLYNWLKKIGFKYKTIDKRSAVMETRRIVNWRNSYLQKIREYKNESRPIYFLDETWYDSHDTAKKGWTNENK